jgi:sodium-dependent dicarboxylate transporter 2/3/5
MEEEGAGTRRARSFALAAAIAALVYAFPLPGLPEEGRRLAAVMALVATLWVTEVLPLAATAILGPAIAVLVGVAPVKAAFGALANPIVVLFIGSFLIARALEKHRMSERIAYRVLGLGAVKSDPLRAFWFMGFVTAFISAWISNTATVAMMIPIAQSVLLAVSPRGSGGGAEPGRSPRFASALMLLIAYAASIGGLFTPIGTPPNLIGLGLIEQATGIRVSFGDWILRCMPVTLATLLLMMSWMSWRFRGELAALVFDRSQMVAR